MRERTVLGTLRALNKPAPAVVPAGEAVTAAALTSQTDASYKELRMATMPGLETRREWGAPLPLSGESFTQWETRGAEHVLRNLRESRGASSNDFSHAAMQLAELGQPGLAAEALLERLESRPADTLCWGTLGKVMLLAGCPDKALTVAQAAKDRLHLEPVVATNIIVKAMLMKGMHTLAHRTVHAQRRRSSLLHSMVRHADNSPHSQVPMPKAGDISSAKEALTSWRGGGWQPNSCSGCAPPSHARTSSKWNG